ncbi:ABC transporter permease [Streptomyces sp. NBC_00056]|uniref:ABC transporter permease n=1 Tax=unclassified Streptomyces TaxID=2593676 RepID=UPI00225B7543|nr:ABC transporter permease [Streptomyces sp. NBC_00063]MCX5440976.1 ABC transporter permease [Streptomyces sp. NBC_00063]
MMRYLVGRLPSLVLVLVASSVVAFALPRLAPGDVAVSIAGTDATQPQIDAIRKQLGLNHALTTQYWDWISGLFHGDLGESYLLHRSVASLIGDRLESTLELAVVALVMVMVIGLVLGIAGGSRRGRWARAVLDMFSSLLIAIPSFLFALALILVFGVFQRWLPVSGEVGLFEDPWIGIQYLLLPAFALALAPGAVVGRMLQTEMLKMRGEDFVDLALAKGVAPRRITRRHVLRNSVGSAVVGVGLQAGNLLAGAVVIEAVFSRNGLGQLAVASVETRDFTVLQVIILGVVLVAALCQILTEIVLAAIDPRVRLGESA